MLNDPDRFLALLRGLSVFGLVITIWLLGVLLWAWRKMAHGKRLDQRLRHSAFPQGATSRTLRLWHEGKEASTTVPGLKVHRTMVERLEDLRREPGLDITLKTMLLGFFGLLVGTFVLGLGVTRDFLLSTGIAVASVAGLIMYLKGRLKKRIDLFERQFIEALGLATRSLRAGHPLPASFRLIAEEMRPPISIVFGKIWQQEALGIGIREAIEKSAEGSRSSDLRLFATATSIQLQSGGNMAEMMDRLSEVIRARIRLHRKARILTAQAQFSKLILAGLPFVLFVALHLLNPDYLSPLYTTGLGRILLVAAGGLLMIGVWAMDKLGTLKY